MYTVLVGMHRLSAFVALADPAKCAKMGISFEDSGATDQKDWWSQNSETKV